MLYLDYLAHNNGLKEVSIGEKLLLGGGGLVLALALPQPVTLLAVVFVMHGVMLFARTPPGYLCRLWLGPLAFLLTGICSVVISVSAESFAALTGIWIGPYFFGVTYEGLAAAEVLLLRSLAAVSCLLMIATTTPVAHVAAYLSRFPAIRGVAEIATLTYRFIFVFLAAAGQIYTAQQSRLGYVDARRSLHSLAYLTANVGRKTFLGARDLTTALNARNYHSRLSFYYPRQQVVPSRLALIAAALIALALSALV
ncbi:MAG: cobalt ECF transporter T component CbiQ [Negativicutes bacterium]|nr:cobalt ECF transporter T component CbiQ [Negativicutes bacterium]